MKFRKGDIVIGNDTASLHYYITKKDWTGEVVDVKDERCFTAKSTGSGIPFYGLNTSCFDLLTPAVDRDQLIALLS